MNGHSPISGRWSLQMLIDLPEFRHEGLPLFEITLGELHQVVQVPATMVAAHRLVQGLPHQLYRIALGAPRREPMQTDAPCRALHVLLDPPAGMARVVVHGQVQFFVTAVGPAQLFEQLDEQLAVLSLARDPMEAPGLEVECPADPHFAVRPRGPQRFLLALAHPAEADPRVGLESGLVLEEGARLLDHRKDVQEPRPLSLFVLFGAVLGPDRTWPPPAEAQAMKRAANRLPAYQGGPLLEQFHGQKLAAPARSQPSVGGGRLLFDQTLEVLSRRLPDRRFGPAPTTILEGAHPPFLLDEALDEGVDGAPGTVKDSGDLGGREAVRGEQGY